MSFMIDIKVAIEALARAANLAKDGPQDIRAGKYILKNRVVISAKDLQPKKVEPARAS